MLGAGGFAKLWIIERGISAMVARRNLPTSGWDFVRRSFAFLIDLGNRIKVRQKKILVPQTSEKISDS